MSLRVETTGRLLACSNLLARINGAVEQPLHLNAAHPPALRRRISHVMTKQLPRQPLSWHGGGCWWDQGKQRGCV